MSIEIIDKRELVTISLSPVKVTDSDSAEYFVQAVKAGLKRALPSATVLLRPSVQCSNEDTGVRATPSTFNLQFRVNEGQRSHIQLTLNLNGHHDVVVNCHEIFHFIETETDLIDDLINAIVKYQRQLDLRI